MRLCLAEASREGEKNKKKKEGKKKPSSFRWLEIRLAAESRDLILPLCAQEGLLSQDGAQTSGRSCLCCSGPCSRHRRGFS